MIDSVQDHNQRSATVWSSGGAAYDRISRGIADPIEHAVVRLNPQPGERILDLATGTGWTSRSAWPVAVRPLAALLSIARLTPLACRRASRHVCTAAAAPLRRPPSSIGLSRPPRGTVSHHSITRWTHLAVLLAGLASVPAAQAYVITTTVGNTTIYSENFDGGTDFFGDAWTPASPTGGGDNFIEFGPDYSTSRFTFESDAPISSLSLTFRYSGELDGPNGTVSLSRFEDSELWSPYYLATLGDTPGNFFFSNPGLFLNGNESGRDAPFSLTLTNLPAGLHLLSFDRLLPSLIGGSSQPRMRVDDVVLSVTTVSEPGSVALLGIALAALAVVRRGSGAARPRVSSR